MKYFLENKIKNLSYKLVSSFKKNDPINGISLFCDPRGGSTWLAETLNSIPNSIIIDEPLHLNNNKQLNQLGFSWRQNIPEEINWSEAKSIFNTILKGQKLNTGFCNRNTYLEVLRFNQVILKIIRGKALLPWYVNQFNFKYKPVVVVRHPFAIAASQLNHSAWNYGFEKFKVPEGPYNQFYKEHAPFLKSLQSKEEQLTALWCMTNNVVLKHPKNNQSWITLNYEHLILEPMKYFNLIFKEWNMAIPEKLEGKISKPSSTTDKLTLTPQHLLSDWKNKINSTQINRLQDVLNYFEVDYYNEGIMPSISANKVHLNNAKK